VTSRIRPATLEDAGVIALIQTRSWQAAYRGLLPQEVLDQLDLTRRTERWRQILDDMDPARHALLVAESDELAAGFASIGPARDQDTDPARTGEVRAIYLLPQSWGQGLGRELMTAALEQLAVFGHQQAILWVLDANTRARRFYAAAGFTADGTAKTEDIGGSPVTEVRYRRDLP
jgi:GNAT superfamily N-acetyltransferase